MNDETREFLFEDAKYQLDLECSIRETVIRDARFLLHPMIHVLIALAYCFKILAGLWPFEVAAWDCHYWTCAVFLSVAAVALAIELLFVSAAIRPTELITPPSPRGWLSFCADALEQRHDEETIEAQVKNVALTEVANAVDENHLRNVELRRCVDRARLAAIVSWPFALAGTALLVLITT